MKELTANEINEVAGGNPIALAALLFAIVINADKLSEFVEGVIDGYNKVPPK